MVEAVRSREGRKPAYFVMVEVVGGGVRGLQVSGEVVVGERLRVCGGVVVGERFRGGLESLVFFERPTCRGCSGCVRCGTGKAVDRSHGLRGFSLKYEGVRMLAGACCRWARSSDDVGG